MDNMNETEHRNRVLQKFAADEVVLVASVTPVASPKVAELLGMVGFDCVWIDMEHQDYSYDQVFNLCLACRAAGAESMVRIRREGRHACARAFEAGATGIMVPHCMGAEDARQIVREARFHPLGLRGLDGVEATARYGLMSPVEYMDWANRETFIVVQIEDHEAVEEVDAIAAVPGIDALFVGITDLSQSYGVPMQLDSEPVRDALARVAAATAKHGKHWGSPGLSPANAQRLVDMGARFVTTTSAIAILRAGFLSTFGDYSRVASPVAREDCPVTIRPRGME